MAKRKSIQQTETTVRKKTSQDQQRRKIRRIAFFQKDTHAFQIPILSNVHEKLGRVPFDCSICVMQKLHIISKKEADQARQRYGKTTGVSMQTILDIFHQKFPGFDLSWRHVTDISFHAFTESILPGYCCVIVLSVKTPVRTATNVVGKHVTILFKDEDGTLGIIDPQMGSYCRGDCRVYFNFFNTSHFWVLSTRIRKV